jgi:hypothetical protein
LKCGGFLERRYIVEHIEDLEEFFKAECSCGNNEIHRIKIKNFDVKQAITANIYNRSDKSI